MSRSCEPTNVPPFFWQTMRIEAANRILVYCGARGSTGNTVFSEECTYGAWQGTKLELDSSFGPAAQLGIDIDVIPGWFINLDARWFDIDTNAKLGGTDVGTIEIDPYAFGVTVGHRF